MNRLYRLSLLILPSGSVGKKRWLGTEMSSLGKAAPLLCGVDKTTSLRNALHKKLILENRKQGQRSRYRCRFQPVGCYPLLNLSWFSTFIWEWGKCFILSQLGWEGVSGLQCLCCSFRVRYGHRWAGLCSSSRQSSPKPLGSPRSFIPMAAPWSGCGSVSKSTMLAAWSPPRSPCVVRARESEVLTNSCVNSRAKTISFMC